MELQKQNCCRSASGDVDMMKVMVGARVESDRARSVLDGRGRLHAVLPMAQSAGVPTDVGRCRRRATLRDALSGMTAFATAGNVTDQKTQYLRPCPGPLGRRHDAPPPSGPETPSG